MKFKGIFSPKTWKSGKSKPAAGVNLLSKASDTVPEHVAIIMDGNSRWARAHGLPAVAGHQKGAEVARQVVETASQVGVRFLTLYAFSSENWARSEGEISALMELLRHYLTTEIPLLCENDIRLKIIGNRQRLPKDIQQLVVKAEEQTALKKGLTLIMALSYGGREEVTHACRAVAYKVKEGVIDPETITEEVVKNHLYTFDIPDPDVLIRTSGEERISNFLIWQISYTELFFVSSYWPDFSRDEFLNVIKEYSKRERRFGHASET